MRVKIFSAIFLLGCFSFVNAQTVIKETKETAPAKTDTSATTQTGTNGSADPKVDPKAATQQNTEPYVRPEFKKRVKSYVNSIVGPMTLAENVGYAGLATWRNSPEEWGDHWEGFGRRVASNFGKNVVKQTTIYGLDEALKYDSRFYRSKKRDTKSRIINALLSPVTARNEEGKRVVGIPRIVG